VPSTTDLAALATLACLLEAGAPKPGNVSPGRRFRDMTWEDFLVSAVAMQPVLAHTDTRPLGETILAAVEATRRWTSANTNLGILLLLVPLVKAAGRRGGTLRERVREVLATTTVADATRVYSAIRASRPGGMGTVPEQDISAAPSVTLLEAMHLAAGRDAIAGEYASGFARTFETGVPALRAARRAGLGWQETVVETGLALLSAVPDSLIARKLGPVEAEAVRARAAAIQRLGGVRTAEGRAELAAFDAELRDPQNSRNPGTTADLTAAAIFVALAEDGWQPDR